MGSSNNSAETISLPKGGGAVKGMGETFSPDLFTGTGNFTVPITLPHGRNGFQPQISLGYSTGSGNGPFGMGWSLSVPGVSRKTSKGIPRYRDGIGRELSSEADVFILSGAEDLVPVTGAVAGAQRYRPRTEGLFALIDRVRDDKNDYWKVQSKDGLVSYYGVVNDPDDKPSVVAHPDDPKQIFDWKLGLTEDRFGNRIEYRYIHDGEDGKPTNWSQTYLKQIRYGDYTTADGQQQYFSLDQISV
jgi:Salmonella virulence plasmid 65kDa B protein